MQWCCMLVKEWGPWNALYTHNVQVLAVSTWVSMCSLLQVAELLLDLRQATNRLIQAQSFWMTRCYQLYMVSWSSSWHHAHIVIQSYTYNHAMMLHTGIRTIPMKSCTYPWSLRLHRCSSVCQIVGHIFCPAPWQLAKLIFKMLVPAPPASKSTSIWVHHKLRLSASAPNKLNAYAPEPHRLSAPEPCGTSPGICTGTLPNLRRYLHRNPPEPHQVPAPELSGALPSTSTCTGTSTQSLHRNPPDLTRYLHRSPL